ncbi:MAG: hypothetical protein IKT58_01165 [Oscillospiraceae bacterium]|nr:hypothetical protein [Oscillospiraceae bacterium]
MATKKARKNRKRKPLAPPLSFLDRCIYGIVILMSFTLPIVGIILLMHFAERKYTADPTVLAYACGNEWLCLFPFVLYILISGLVWGDMAMTDRKPLFGRKDVRYGPPQWAPIYPVFSKKYRKVWRRPAHSTVISLKRKGTRAWLIGLAVTLLLSTFAIGCRRTVTEGDVFHRISSFGRETIYTPEDPESLSIGIHKVGKTPGNYTLSMTFSMKDGRNMRFSMGNFTEGTRMECLAAMLRLKSYVDPQNISYYGQRRLLWYMSKEGFSYEERLLFSQLYPEYSITEVSP